MESNVFQSDQHHHNKVSFEAHTSIASKLHHLTPRPPIPKRKYSFPAALHANLLGLSALHKEEPLTNHTSNTRRRFSNVGDVVSRKLSHTIGWRTPSVPTDEVISQGKILCGQYIRNRLKRSGIFNKKLGLYRLRSMIGTTSGNIIREVFPCLVCAGTELERMHPKIYTNVTRQACISPTSILVSDKAVAGLLMAISHQMFKTDINWGKIVALYAVAGGLAVDCIHQGHPEFLQGIMEGMTEILETNLGEWIASNGGWIALCQKCRPKHQEVSLLEHTSLVLIGLVILLTLYFMLRFIIGRIG